MSAPTPRARHLMGGLIPMGAGMGAGMLLGDATWDAPGACWADLLTYSNPESP